MTNQSEMSVQTPENEKTPLPKGRPKNSKNKTNYHWRVYEKDTGNKYSFVTLKDLKMKYGMSRGTAYLMYTNPERAPHKYKNLKIEKDVRHHYLVPVEEILKIDDE